LAVGAACTSAPAVDAFKASKDISAVVSSATHTHTCIRTHTYTHMHTYTHIHTHVSPPNAPGQSDALSPSTDMRRGAVLFNEFPPPVFPVSLSRDKRRPNLHIHRCIEALESGQKDPQPRIGPPRLRRAGTKKARRRVSTTPGVGWVGRAF
jgi:hypothetical protein